MAINSTQLEVTTDLFGSEIHPLKDVTSNMTGSNDHLPPKTSFLSFITLFLVIVLPAATAHSLAFFVLYKDLKYNLTPVKGLLFALCCTDVIGVVVIVAHHVIGKLVENPPFPVCATIIVSLTFVSLMSGAMATMMAAERCMAMRAPFWYRVNKSHLKTFVVPITLIFLLTLGVSLLGPTPLGLVYKPRLDHNESLRCSSFPVQSIRDSIQGVFSLAFTVVGLAIALVNISINAAVIVTMREMNAKAMRVKTADPSVNVAVAVQHQYNSDKKTAEYELTKMLLILSACFLVCWVPIYISRIMNDMGYNIPRVFRSFSHTLAGLNYVLDPIIYIIAMKSYRQRIHTALLANRARNGGSNVSRGQSSKDHNEAVKLAMEKGVVVVVPPLGFTLPVLLKKFLRLN
ncbi:5-hydroxytryptamine receptor 4-like [Gigantopelta aegis]|uniref:5-hydroxytryptamine receptor 4-like n=1 Tax=Gigantopelta aegis TaxID=1735272 RepID=UPI001B88DC6C|nr:5-hydroxytryptamine receptor 4-like [Gigantopelta aegis]